MTRATKRATKAQTQPAPELTLEEAVGRRVRELRTERGWTQVQLAQGMAVAGLTDWRRLTVTALESGQRRIQLDEVLVLAHVFGVPVVELLPLDDRSAVAPADDHWVLTLGPVYMNPATAKWHLTGGHDGDPDWTVGEDGILKDRGAELGAFYMERDEANQKAARELGISVQDLVALSRCLWMWGLPRERDRRLKEQPGADQLSPRSRQARRGHITRALLAELRTALDALPHPVGRYHSLDELTDALHKADVHVPNIFQGQPTVSTTRTKANRVRKG